MVSTSDKMKSSMMGAMKKMAQLVHGRTGIFSTLSKEHGMVDALLRELMVTSNAEPARRRELFEKIRLDLLSHAKKEDAIFYEQLARNPQTAERIARFREDHREIERLLEEMASTPIDQQAWHDKAHTLKAVVERHVLTEEKSLFPEAQSVLQRSGSRSLDAQYTTRQVDI